MIPLEVHDLCKTYPSFQLHDLSFTLAAGKITGFVGRNGAGKSTTLKSLFHMVHPESGEIRFFGQDFAAHELEIKRRVGFVTGGVDFYPRSRLSAITRVTRAFYPNWNEAAYERCLARFGLDERKTPSQLSTGMQIKYALALALSHRAELLILDEPTSGLDPVSRDELLDLFLSLCGEGVTILFSTHIISDLDKCADRILYIQNGSLLADSDLPAFVGSYRLADDTAADPLPESVRRQALGARRLKAGRSLLLPAAAAERIPSRPAGLEEIMVHLERREDA